MHNISLISSKKSRQFLAKLFAVQSFAAKQPSFFVAKTLRDGVPSLSSRSPSCPGTTHVASAHLFNLRGAWDLFKMTTLAYLNLQQGAKI